MSSNVSSQRYEELKKKFYSPCDEAMFWAIANEHYDIAEALMIYGYGSFCSLATRRIL